LLLFFHLRKGKENMYGNNIFIFQVDEIEVTFVWGATDPSLCRFVLQRVLLQMQ
jgi:hypothetical protein